MKNTAAPKSNCKFLLPLILMFLPFLPGCAITGVLADKVLPKPPEPPKYVGLQGQSVGIMVYTDRGLQIDYPTLSLDLANSVEKKLRSQSGKDGAAELKESTFPVQPASIARYQQDHPNLDMKNVVDVAPRLGVTRLIYIEIDDFATRAVSSVDLFRGSMSCTMKVVEVSGNTAHVACTVENLQAVYPPKVPPDGTPEGDDVRFYVGTVDAMSTVIFKQLVSHEQE